LASKSKTDVNRRNARRSTGPRSVRGKARSAQNARRHGLAGANPLGALSKEVEALARALVGDDLDPERLVNARTMAQMEVMLGRICDARIALINGELKKQIEPIRPAEDRSECDEPTAPKQQQDTLYANDFGEAEALVRVLPELLRLQRYEAHALARRSRALLFLCR
jgi:hypothetical protein